MRLRVSVRIAALAALLLAALPAGVPAVGQTGGWSEATVLEDSFGWWPSIAVDPLGGVHALWNDGVESGRDALIYRTKGSAGWSVPHSVLVTVRAPRAGYAMRNGISVTADGIVHVTYRDGTEIVYAHSPLEDAWSAQGWLYPPLRISGFGAAYYADIASDRNGVLHAVWTVQMPENGELGGGPRCLMCSDVYYRRSADGGRSWSMPVNLSQSVWGSVKPRIHADDDGTVFVKWDEGFDWYVSAGEPQGVGLAVSRDGGLTWGPPRVIGKPVYAPAPGALAFGEEARWFADDVPQDAALGMDGDGNLVLAYRRVLDAQRRVNDRGIYYQVSRDDGMSWSEPAAIEGAVSRSSVDTGLDCFDMAVDTQGNLHLIFVGAVSERDSGTAIYHTTWDGTAWTPPEMVRYTEDYAEWPRIAVDRGDGLHVVWHERRADQIFSEGERTYRVFYAERPNRPVPAATLAPTATTPPTSTSTPTPTRAVTPYPTPLPTSADLDGRSSSDMMASSTVLIALTPVVLLVIVVLLMRGFRLRH